MDESGELDELIELNQEGFNDFNLNLEGRGLYLELSQLNQEGFEVDSEGSIDLFVFDLVDIDVNTNCDSQGSLFNNLMNVFVDLNNLRHKDNLLNDLFKKVRNLDNLFLSGEDWDYFFLESWNSLKLSLNNVSNVFF